MEWSIKVLLLCYHVLAGIALVFFFSPASLLISLIGYILIIKFGIECGFHRLFCHRSFQTGRKREIALMFLGSIAGFGSPLSWSAVHRLHHRYADTEQDPHGNIRYHRVWFTFWRKFTIYPKQIWDLIKDPVQVRFHENYFLIILATAVVMTILHPTFFIYGVCIPSIIGFHSAALVNIICHRQGYRNFETADRSHNNKWVNLLVGGNGLHNNHHAQPNAWDYRVLPGEFDAQAQIIRLFLIKKDGNLHA